MLFSSSFLRAIATLSAGQISAAIIPFLAAPVLGRLYTPEDYGLLAAYTAIVNVSASVVTLHYQHGILTERTEQRANQMAFLSMIATVCISVFLIPVAILVFMLNPFEVPAKGYRAFFFMLPVSALIVGTSLSAMAVANRARGYRKIAVMLFSAAAVSATASVAFAGLRSDGLFIAYLLSQIVTFAFSVAILFRHHIHECGASIRKIRSLAVRHRGYPIFTMPAAFIQSISLQLPIFVLTYFGEASLMGSFSRAQSLSVLPITLLSGAIGRVYFQRAAEEYNQSGTCRPLFLRTLPLVFVLALPVLVMFGLFGPTVFSLYLGQNWSEAGMLAQILAPVFFLQMFVGTLGGSILFAGNQRLSLFIQLVGVVLATVGCAVPIITGMPVVYSITGWAVAIGTINIIQIWLGWELSSVGNRLSSLLEVKSIRPLEKRTGGRLNY